MSIKSISASVIFSLILLAATSAVAQDQATTGVTISSSAAVTAAVTGPNAIRLTSPGEISNIRLEVYAPTGALAFDSGLRSATLQTRSCRPTQRTNPTSTRLRFGLHRLHFSSPSAMRTERFR
jgi:hypothetical protein